MLLHSTINSIAQSIDNQPPNRRSQRSKIECQTRFDNDFGTDIGPQTTKSATDFGTENDAEICSNRYIFGDLGGLNPPRWTPGGPGEPRRVPGGSPEGPGEPRESPKTLPGHPWSPPRSPKGAPRVAQGHPGAPRSTPKRVKWRPERSPDRFSSRFRWGTTFEGDSRPIFH